MKTPIELGNSRDEYFEQLADLMEEHITTPSINEEARVKELILSISYDKCAELMKRVEELETALKPLLMMADECLNNPNLSKQQIVYAYNKAQITMTDLQNVKTLLTP